MRVVWLDGARVEPSAAALSIDDPAVRWGEGLFETMRAEGGRVALLDAHLERLSASATTLGLAPMPGVAEARAVVAAVLEAAGPAPARVRLTVTPRPTLLVEVTPEEPLAADVPAADRRHGPGRVDCRATGSPSTRPSPTPGHRWSQRRASAAGVDHALLLDADGRLGEAAVASAFCVVDGAILTAPADGLLAGVGRTVVVRALDVREEAAAEAAWRAASEIILTNAVRGAVAVVSVDGAPVGDGTPGPAARRIHAVLRAALGAG